MPWYAKVKIDWVDQEHNVRLVKGKDYRVAKDTYSFNANAVQITLHPLSQDQRYYFMIKELAKEVFEKPEWKS